MRKYFIERDILEVGTFERDQLRGAAEKSNEGLRQLASDVINTVRGAGYMFTAKVSVK